MTNVRPTESNSETNGYKDKFVDSSTASDKEKSAKNFSAPDLVEQQSQLVEAILFLEPEPQDFKSLSRLTQISVRRLALVIEKVRARFAESTHGVQLIELAEGYTLVPKPELWNQLAPNYGSLSKFRLSRAALETLAIIAYSQPITRSEIESIRGVSADSMIRLLYERNLISDMGRKDSPGRPIQYGTSTEFLRSFGLASIAELPKLNDSDREKFNNND